MTVTNNTSELAAQHGIYVSGLQLSPPSTDTRQLASTDFTVTGNVVINPGGAGILLVDAPMRGTISGNSINKVTPRARPTRPMWYGNGGLWFGENLHRAAA